ncbi:MAG: nuclear transport factor 2 family protein [Gemmatimonadota bacterium]|nr:nuclear transport factor 2 family protein [Gemmatimonadota bacterium]
MTRRLWIVALVLTGLACGDRAEPGAIDDSAIRELISTLQHVNNAGDITGWVELFTDDFVLMPANGVAVTTHEGLESTAVSSFSRYRYNITIAPVEIVVMDGWAFARTAVTGSVVPIGDRDPIRVDAKELLILRQQPDGGWKLARLIGNSNLP